MLNGKMINIKVVTLNLFITIYESYYRLQQLVQIVDDKLASLSITNESLVRVHMETFINLIITTCPEIVEYLSNITSQWISTDKMFKQLLEKVPISCDFSYDTVVL
jgi:hypothetical protein